MRQTFITFNQCSKDKIHQNRRAKDSLDCKPLEELGKFYGILFFHLQQIVNRNVAFVSRILGYGVVIAKSINNLPTTSEGPVHLLILVMIYVKDLKQEISCFLTSIF